MDFLETHLSSSQSVKPNASVSPIAFGMRPRHRLAISARRLLTGSAPSVVGEMILKERRSTKLDSNVISKY